MTKIVVSSRPLSEVDSYEECEPCMVDIINNYNDLSSFLSFKAKSLGYDTVAKYLEREEVYISFLNPGNRLLPTEIGH